MTHSQITSFIWSVADLIRDTFKRGKYQDVILPLTVLRRIDQVLEPTKEKVLRTYSGFKGKLDNPDDLLRKASGYAFYNTSLYTFERLVDDPGNVAHNLRTYIRSFSPNMREVIEKFDFDNTITKLDDAGLLFQVMERFARVDLHPDRVSNPMMGTIFEELIRKFNEALNENVHRHAHPTVADRAASQGRDPRPPYLAGGSAHRHCRFSSVPWCTPAVRGGLGRRVGERWRAAARTDRRPPDARRDGGAATVIRGTARAVRLPARSLPRRLPPSERMAFDAGRLAYASPFRAARPSVALAARRNALQLRLARAAVVLHAAPGIRTLAWAADAAAMDLPLYTLDHPANESLFDLGFRPLTQLD